MGMALFGRVGLPGRVRAQASVALAILLAVAGVAHAQGVPGAPSIPLTSTAIANGVQNRITYEYGTEFVTIGAAGNAAYQGSGAANGRGSVGYEYRIGRYEVTTVQWVAFYNAAYGRPQSEAIPHLLPPSVWGAEADPTYSGPGQHWRVIPGQENRPVGDISWRMAAIYCNWLCNDQGTARSAFMNGAYDVSTFGYRGNIFTDQVTHNTNARFWIPTWDEWLKAAHYDPNKNNGQGGYWTLSNATNGPLVYGAPGVGLANATFTLSSSGVNPFAIPLGAYPGTQTPWGLLDAAGATWEWTEGTIVFNTGQNFRIYEGSAWTQGGGDSIGSYGAEFPSMTSYPFGFRVASAIPTPSIFVVSVTFFMCSLPQRRR